LPNDSLPPKQSHDKASRPPGAELLDPASNGVELLASSASLVLTQCQSEIRAKGSTVNVRRRRFASWPSQSPFMHVAQHE
jgi:hypothetical protein